MCRRIWMDDEALDVCDICEEREELQMIDECESFLLATLYLKCEDGGTAIREVFLVELMIRMIRQRRMVYFLYQRMLGQVLYDLLRILCMALEAQ